MTPPRIAKFSRHQLAATVRALIIGAAIAAGPFNALTGSEAAAAPPQSEDEPTVSVTYVWQRGDTLSQVLFRAGLGHARGRYSLYRSHGWIARNVDASKRHEAAWMRLEAGTVVTLVVPSSFAAAFEAETPPTTAGDPDDLPVPPDAASVATDREPDDEAENSEDRRSEPATTAAIEPGSSASRGAPVGDASVPTDPRVAFRGPPAPAPRDDADLAAGSVRSWRQNRIAFLISIFFIVAGAAWLWRRRQRRLEISIGENLAISANAFLASLVVETNSPLGAPELFEAIMAIAGDVDRTSFFKAARVYRDLGFFASDHAWLTNLGAKIERGDTDFDWQWRHDSEEHRTFQRFARDGGDVFCQILRGASSATLRRAALGRFTQVMLEPEQVDLKGSVIGVLNGFQEQLERDPFDLQSQIQAAIQFIRDHKITGSADLPVPAVRKNALTLPDLFDDEGPASETFHGPLAEIDQSASDQLRGLGDDVLPTLSAFYLESIPSRLAAIRNAIKAKDLKEIAFAARAFKSSSIQFGAVSVGNICQMLESLVGNGTVDDAEALMATLDESVRLSTVALRALIATSAAA